MGGALVALWTAMQVQAAGACPTAAEVQRLLAPLLPPGLASAVQDVAAIEEGADGSLTLSLAQFDRGTITRRRLPRARTCGDQAEMVAVALAVWEAQIHSSVALRLDRLSAATTPASFTPEPPPAPDAALRDASAPPRASALVWGLGAGLIGAWQSGSLAPGGRADATLRTSRDGVDGPWRMRLSLAGLSPHTVSLAPGQASWWRMYLAPGADYTWSLDASWALTLGAGGTLGAVRISGSGYSVNHRVTSTDLGAEVLARIERRGAGRVRPWLALSVVTWLRRQRLDVSGGLAGTGAVPELPALEPMATAGADFLWRP